MQNKTEEAPSHATVVLSVLELSQVLLRGEEGL